MHNRVLGTVVFPARRPCKRGCCNEGGCTVLHDPKPCSWWVACFQPWVFPASFLGVRKNNLPLPGSQQIEPVSAVLPIPSFPFRKAITPSSRLGAAPVATLFLLQNVQTVAFLLTCVGTLLGTASWICMKCWQGGREIFSSSSEEWLTQQNPPPALPSQRKPCQTEAPCVLPLCSCQPSLCSGQQRAQILT